MGSNPRLVTAAVVQDSDALQFASAALKQSRTVVMAAVGKPNWSRFFGCTALAEDEDVALTAIGIDWHAAKYISPRHAWDKTVSKFSNGHGPADHWSS